MSNGETKNPGNVPENLTIEGFLNRMNEANKFNYEAYSKLKSIRNQLNVKGPKKDLTDLNKEKVKEPNSILEKMDECIKSYEECNALSNDAVCLIQESLGH